MQEIPRGRFIAKNMTKWAKLLSKKYKNFNFILKVHPNDSIKYWKKFQKNNNIKNLKIVYGLNIYQVLKKSTLHIGAEGCTTIFESIQSGITTGEIVYNKNLTRKIYNKHHLMLCKNKIYNIKNLINLIKKTKTKKTSISDPITS